MDGNGMTRREFVAASAAAALCGRTVFGKPGVAPAFAWGALFHLGANFWDDAPVSWDKMPTTPEAAAEKEVKGPTKVCRVANYVRTEESAWRLFTGELAKQGGNLVIVDLGEAMAYPSHPELAVAGTWSVEKVRGEIARLKKLGLTAVPKLNFSTCHDGWLKDYGRMVSTPTYYRVVADLVADVCEVFDEAPYFHLGFDEEMPIAQVNTSVMVCRQGDLWWHDFLYCVAEVERRGKRAICWSDYMWTNRKAFLDRMPKSVLQSNWYYRRDFGEKKQVWDEAFEKKGGWGECVQGVVTFLELEKAGFDQLPTTSNFFEDGAADPFVAFLKERVSPQRLKGFVTAPWELSRNEKADKVLRGLREFGNAKRKYYA